MSGHQERAGTRHLIVDQSQPDRRAGRRIHYWTGASPYHGNDLPLILRPGVVWLIVLPVWPAAKTVAKGPGPADMVLPLLLALNTMLRPVPNVVMVFPPPPTLMMWFSGPDELSVFPLLATLITPPTFDAPIVLPLPAMLNTVVTGPVEFSVFPLPRALTARGPTPVAFTVLLLPRALTEIGR